MYSQHFIGRHETHDISAERLAIADALRSLASQLESTAQMARIYDDSEYPSSFSSIVPSLPRQITIVTEKHEGVWMAKVFVNPKLAAAGDPEHPHA